MAAAVNLPSYVHEKPCKKQNGGEGEDIISRLPDGVLHHILSFLSTKDAIRTSILSRRWEFLWTSISNIDLNDMFSDTGKSREDYQKRRAFFLDFVERVLLFHNASTIERFLLKFNVQVNASRVNSWISTVVRNKVKELDLSLPLRAQFVLPCCLFTCQSLAVLKLEMDRYLSIPTSISFPNLKTLQISLVTFSDENSIAQLLSSCPVLQDLALLDCGWINIKSLTLRIPTLKSLTFQIDPLWTKDEVLLDCQIKIYATNLIHLNCKTNVRVDLLLYDLSSLGDAYIEIWNQQARREEVAHRAINLLNSIVNVECLTISAETLLSLYYTENVQDDLHTFSSLTNLVVDSEISPYLAGVLVDFLRKLTNLEFLEISAGFDPDTLFDEDLTLGSSVPLCLRSCFRTFDYVGLEGKAEEIHLLEFFLKNATHLESMSIYCLEDLLKDTQKREEISTRLEMLPRGSERCVIQLL